MLVITVLIVHNKVHTSFSYVVVPIQYESMGIVRGKLDQLRRCFEVQFAAGRDLKPGQLRSMIQTLSSWLSTSDSPLVSIQDKDQMGRSCRCLFAGDLVD
ncbi:COP9 signalosome complex subunit 7-like [Papaver somniferum]|uniref:COP9 signalosome complex subunit 7-like n=1 Tax=Papaver somniferum TaxID=3469 RepID=UPI000E703BFE|nr:COP9 signalosome complex subunit 7-like [Papaver somniferum]